MTRRLKRIVAAGGLVCCITLSACTPATDVNVGEAIHQTAGGPVEVRR